jgi:hypothetical protein
MNEEYKQHVLGRLRAMGPCTLDGIIYELRTQAVGPWDDGTMFMEQRRLAAKDVAVQCLNELCREGKAELYETGDAWDIRHEETCNGTVTQNMQHEPAGPGA